MSKPKDQKKIESIFCKHVIWPTPQHNKRHISKTLHQIQQFDNMVNIVTPELDITDFDETLEVIWEQQIQNNAPILDFDLELDLEWNATVEESPGSFDVVMDNNYTWDENDIPDPPVLVRQNAMDHVTLHNNLHPIPITQPVNVVHYIAPNHNLL